MTTFQKKLFYWVVLGLISGTLSWWSYDDWALFATEHTGLAQILSSSSFFPGYGKIGSYGWGPHFSGFHPFSPPWVLLFAPGIIWGSVTSCYFIFVEKKTLTLVLKILGYIAVSAACFWVAFSIAASMWAMGVGYPIAGFITTLLLSSYVKMSLAMFSWKQVLVLGVLGGIYGLLVIVSANWGMFYFLWQALMAASFGYVIGTRPRDNDASWWHK